MQTKRRRGVCFDIRCSFRKKKVARLPSKDREEVMKVLRDSKVMKVLKRKIRNRRRQRERVTRSVEEDSQGTHNDSSSMALVNKEWQNWVVLRGNEEAKAKDIKGIGDVISVSFKGNNQNKFSVLSRPKVVEKGPMSMPEVEGVDVVDGEA